VTVGSWSGHHNWKLVKRQKVTMERNTESKMRISKQGGKKKLKEEMEEATAVIENKEAMMEGAVAENVTVKKQDQENNVDGGEMEVISMRNATTVDLAEINTKTTDAELRTKNKFHKKRLS
jgi:hypothetical protein